MSVKEDKPYLIFSLLDSRYGVDLVLVQEIFPLPELTPIVSAPNDIIGLLDLRGKIIPVMHLACRLGYQHQECHLSDRVIVLNWEGLQIGILVNQVHEVNNINSEAIEGIFCGRVEECGSQFIIGVAKVDAEPILLLNHEQLIRYSDVFEARLSQATANNRLVWCSNASLEERTIFRERALNLRALPISPSLNELIPLAVFSLNDEYFGIELELVREFTSIHNIAPIPCCPVHIIGNMNLRGEIITLIDVRRILNIPNVATSNSLQAIVIQIEDLVVGLLVERVFDVMYLSRSNIKSIPTAVHSDRGEYLRGTISYLEKVLSILDLRGMLLEGVLTVEEEV